MKKVTAEVIEQYVHDITNIKVYKNESKRN